MKFSQAPIGDTIKNLSREAEERDAERQAKKEDLPYLDLRNQAIDRTALELVSEATAREAKAVAFDKDKKSVKIATTDSKSNEFNKMLLLLEEQKFKSTIFISSLSGLKEAWGQYVSVRVEDRGEIVSEIKLGEGVIESKSNIKSTAQAVEDVSQIDSDVSTTDALVKILADAVVLRASDIHIEADKENATIRFRIDGMLHEIAKIPKDVHGRLVGRLKLLANLKLNIKNEAQDGRFSIRRSGKDIESRVSIIPAEYGESAVLRILDPDTIDLELVDLGLREEDKETLLENIKMPNGMVLVTGPTGSGKTTTLYTLLKIKNSSETKAITIEDPIEYHLDGIEQTQVSPKDGYTFASGLRSVLRQDPDIILVGEIRDKETASTAIDAALTGHLVFSTLHTNSASGAIPRLIDLGVKSDSITPAINLIIAQRLVRRLCEKCKTPSVVDAELKSKIENFLRALPQNVRPTIGPIALYEKSSCDACEDGFRGRVGIFELLSLDSSFEEVFGLNVGEAKIMKHARNKGMVYMQEDGVIKALSGTTTLEEVERATGSIKWPEAPVE